MDAVAGAIGFDGYCLFGVDPLSGLRTVMFSRNGLQVPTRRLVENETREHDANRYVDLAHGPQHAGVLRSHAVHARPSPRLNEILRPEGYTSELRVVLMSSGRYWGALSLFRADPRHPFSDVDTEGADALSEALSHAVRRYQIGRSNADRRASRAGVVIVDRDGSMCRVSEDAMKWLTAMRDPWEHGATEDDVSRVVLEVAGAARDASGDPICRVRMPGGSWLVVSGSRIEGTELDVAVVLQPGDMGTVAPAFAVWCGLTVRESRVLGLVASGLAAKQMAHRLDLSVLTVNDHLRAIYRKAHVHGRDELLSLL